MVDYSVVHVQEIRYLRINQVSFYKDNMKGTVWVGTIKKVINDEDEKVLIIVEDDLYNLFSKDSKNSMYNIRTENMCIIGNNDVLVDGFLDNRQEVVN